MAKWGSKGKQKTKGGDESSVSAGIKNTLDTKIVAGDNVSAPKRTLTNIKRVLRGNKKLQVVLPVLALIVAGVVYLAIAGNIRSRASRCDLSLTSSIYDEAIQALKTNDDERIKSMLSTIEAEPDYDKDYNCLYPFVSYYMSRDDIENARKYYIKFDSASKSEDELAQPYKNTYFKSVKDVEFAYNAYKRPAEGSGELIIVPPAE